MCFLVRFGIYVSPVNLQSFMVTKSRQYQTGQVLLPDNSTYMYLVMLLITWDHSEINMMLKTCQHMFPNKLTFQWSRRTFLCYHICSSTWAEHIRQPFSLIDQRSFSWVSSFLYSPISSLLVQRNNKTIAHGFWHMSCKIVYYCLILRVSSVNYFQSVKLGKP